jgi:voltage-gated potassium channel
MNIKHNIYRLIDEEKGNHRADAYLDFFISGLIILNVVAVFFESYDHLDASYKTGLHWFELFSIAIFTTEYILRIWTADLKYSNEKPLKAKLKFIFSTYGIIDLIAIIPFFLPLITKLDLRILRSLRLFRLLRIFKLGRHSSSLKLIGSVLKETKYDLAVTTFVVFILLIISSTLMFYLENGSQPEAFNNIGQSLWWAVATLTTVGYGDIYPITVGGKILGSIIALLGIGIVALPTGIISSAFIEKIQERKQKKNIACNCPHCGKEI